MCRQIKEYSDYVAAGGETFDSIAFRTYGEERMAHHILRANPGFSDMLVFEGGERLKIPILETVQTPDTLPPWRRPRNTGKTG